MFPTIWSVRHCHFYMSVYFVLLCGLYFIWWVALGTFAVFTFMIAHSLVNFRLSFSLSLSASHSVSFCWLFYARTFLFQSRSFFISYFTALYIIFYGSTPAIVIGNLYRYIYMWIAIIKKAQSNEPEKRTLYNMNDDSNNNNNKKSKRRSSWKKNCIHI